MLRKFLAAATVLLLAFGLTSVVGTAASAHAGNMTVGVVCNTTTGKYDVTYTLHWTQAPSGGGTGHYRLGESSFINNWSYPGGKTWTDFSINSGTGSKSWTQSLPGNTVGNGPWTYAYIVWADGYNQQKVFDTRVEGLKGDCTTPKPDPVTGKETRTTEVCTSPADGTLTVKKFRVRIWNVPVRLEKAWSKDGGVTWGRMTATSLPNPSAGIDALRLADGRFLLVYNPSPTSRAKLALAVSADGKAWRQVLLLEDAAEGEFSYPAMIQSRDGQVHITYTWRREKIKHVAIDPATIDK